MIRQTLTLNKSALFTNSQLATALIFAEALISVCTNTLIATILGFGYIEDCGFLMSPFVNNILFYFFVFKSRLNYESGFCSKSSTEAAYFFIYRGGYND